MKISKHIILLAASCLLSLSLSARQFEQDEKIYVNADQTFHDGCYNWTKDGAKMYLYIWKKSGTTDSNQQWLTMSVETGDLFCADMPAGDFNRCIVVRGSSADWGGKWSQTGDLTFPEVADRNYIGKFWENGTSADWYTYTPSEAKIGTYAKSVTAEKVKICSQALKGPYSLHVKLKANGQEYDYENVQCHGWYTSSDGNTWTSVDGYAGEVRDGEMDKDIQNNLLPESGPIYYYLHSAKAAGRRLIKITADATGCSLDCEITSFEVACSAVNANDTTFTLDGMVAFGKAQGDLVVECDGNSTTIAASKAKSPQTFSIPGIKAIVSGSKKLTAKAYFESGSSKCSAETTFDVPNATQGMIVTDRSVEIGDSIVLHPDGADFTNDHEWYMLDENGEMVKLDTQGELTTTPRDEIHTDTYIYREFNPPTENPGNMMDNGSYEAADENTYKTTVISEYDFWGKYNNKSTKTDYYASHAGASNGFAVVQSANNFAGTYAKVSPRDGDFFALFDAASGTKMAGKKAWYATTAHNPNLKLKKGTTYLFSFWAANINNYGEMDNAAQLEFRINGKKLGKTLDLKNKDFRNNRWHQCSATYYADADANSVEISVVNLNSNPLNIGNDFALDDIQFRAVSNNAKVVKTQQVFIVSTIDPCVKNIYRKWDNVLFVDNHDSIYVAYQWFKNDKKLEGETLQRLYTGAVKMAGTKDLYHCLLTRKDGKTEKTCQYTFDAAPSSAEVARGAQKSSVLVYPTKLPKGAAVTIVKAEESDVTAVLTTITGQTITVAELRDEQSTLPMPNIAGMYLLQLQGTSTHTTVKINVY